MLLSNLCKILIVDDEYLLRQGIKHLVDWEKEGFEIVGEASNGMEALSLLESLKPHIIISDIVMPVMDGVDFSKIVKTKYPEIQIIILSAYSDFSYVKNTFKFGVNDYILKPKLNPEELLALLKNAAGNIPNLNLSPSDNSGSFNVNSLLSKLISGFDSDLKIENLKDNFPHDSFCLTGCNIKKLSYKSSMNLSSLKSVLSHEAKHSLKDTIYYEIDLSSDLFLLLINFENHKYHDILQKIDAMVFNLSKDVSNIFFIISKTFISLYNLKDIYENNFNPLFGYIFYFKDKNVISYSDLPKNNIRKFDFKYYSEQIYMLNINDALDYLRDYLNNSIKNCNINEFELKTLFENAIYNVINILDELNFDIEKLSSSKMKYFQSIDDASFACELLDILDDITNDIAELLNAKDNPLNDHIINEIIEYIGEHYNEQLSLKQLADKFHFNYYYLSSYFSSHNKEGISEYVTKIRVEKAAELLRNDKIPISEISYMVGYSEHSYFCKVFKKLKKLTPSRFRKKYS